MDRQKLRTSIRRLSRREFDASLVLMIAEYFHFLDSVIEPNIVLIARAFRHQFVVPDFLGFTKDIEEIYWKCKSNTDGKVKSKELKQAARYCLIVVQVASYIPQLARVNPDYWGVSVCTIDGQRFSIGKVLLQFGC